jgi:hypothetical protein
MDQTYDARVKLALFCANSASMSVAASPRGWLAKLATRLTCHYRGF